MRISVAEKKRKKDMLAALRQQRDSYLEKARECVVYNDAKGYYFWLESANQVCQRIEAIHWPDGPKTERRVRAGEVIITLRKQIKERESA